MLLCLLYGTDVDVPIHKLLYSYFFFNSGMENRILSQMCGRLYFPIFLFRVGLFTLMYIDSLMVLARKPGGQEAFEKKAIETALHPPRIWKRYVDDTFVLQDHAHKEEFLQHLNSVDLSIKFTVEEAKEDGSIPFLDTIIRPEEDGTFTIGVYRKPTHTDLYLPWDSNHNIAAKYSVINTLSHRALTISSTPELAEQELQHLEKVLMQCKYPTWAIRKTLRTTNRRRRNQPLTTDFLPSVILWCHTHRA